MKLPKQTVALLHSARQLVDTLPADAVLLLPEANLPWGSVQEHLNGCELLIATSDAELAEKIKQHPELYFLDIDPGPTPTQERMSLALLEAVRCEKLRPNSDVVVLYNGIDIGTDKPEHIDSVSVIHLGEHIEKLDARDLRQLDTQVPLEALRAVVDLAVEIGREGREAEKIGTMFVIGDTKKVLSMSHSMNFNPFRGYNKEMRDVRNKEVREALKELSKLDGAFILSREGICESACMQVSPGVQDITISQGFGTRHASAAAISSATKAVAVVVSQSSGTVRIFQNGEVVLTIEPHQRPMIWRSPRLEARDGDGQHEMFSALSTDPH